MLSYYDVSISSKMLLESAHLKSGKKAACFCWVRTLHRGIVLSLHLVSALKNASFIDLTGFCRVAGASDFNSFPVYSKEAACIRKIFEPRDPWDPLHLLRKCALFLKGFHVTGRVSRARIRYPLTKFDRCYGITYVITCREIHPYGERLRRNIKKIWLVDASHGACPASAHVRTPAQSVISSDYTKGHNEAVLNSAECNFLILYFPFSVMNKNELLCAYKVTVHAATYRRIRDWTVKLELHYLLYTALVIYFIKHFYEHGAVARVGKKLLLWISVRKSWKGSHLRVKVDGHKYFSSGTYNICIGSIQKENADDGSATKLTCIRPETFSPKGKGL